MRSGVVKGDFTVLTRQQFEEIKEWKKRLFLTDIWFDMIHEEGTPVSVIALLQDYIRPYRHYHIGLPRQVSAVLTLSQDAAVEKGDITDLPIYIRGDLIRLNVYRKPIAHQLVKPTRQRHVDSMTDLAVHLARLHGVDPDLAEIAGLFHDCTKRWTNDEGIGIMKITAPFAIDRDPHTWHQYTGAYYLEHSLGYHQEEVIRAIRHHVDGDDPHPLSQILYLADKLDPSRGYDSSAMIALAENDLDKAVQQERIQQIQYLRAEGKQV